MLAAPAEARMYKWVDEQGRVHYSDRLPPAAVERSREEFDAQGNRVEQVERAKTRAEREAEQRAAEARRQTEAEAARKAAVQARADAILLELHNSEADILRARDRKTGAIDTVIDIMRKQIATNEARLKELRDYKLRHGKSSAKIQDEKAGLLKQIREDTTFINRKQEERARIMEEYAAKLQRFRELQPARQE